LSPGPLRSIGLDGYLALLAGPPPVGGVAQAVSLRGSFAMLAVFAMVVAHGARLRI
jgi:hypothetical protein